MTTVAVTGCSGYLGRTLCELLDAHDGITRVIGIDVREPGFSTGNLEFYRLDVRSPRIADVIAGSDAVVHMAVVYGRPDEIRDVIINGTRNVTRAVATAGVRKLIFVSSGAVYGPHPDNDVPLLETSPVRPARDNAYATAKAEAEQVVASFRDSHPDATVTVLRPAWVLGPGLPARLAGVVEAPVRLAAAGYDVPFQAVHETDAARAVIHTLEHDFPGTFNVCADDAVDDPEALLGQRKLTVGLERAERFRDFAVRAGLLPLADLGALKYPEVMSNELLRATGFELEYSSAEAMLAAAEARRGWIAIAGVRFRLRWAAMAGASVAALAIGSAVRAASARRAKA